MSETDTPAVRAPVPGVTVIEISGEVTRESDLILKEAMSARPKIAFDHPGVRLARVHELSGIGLAW